VFEARSATFIPAALADNPDQDNAAYRGVLAGLPAELRAAYRDGDFRRRAQGRCVSGDPHRLDRRGTEEVDITAAARHHDGGRA